MGGLSWPSAGTGPIIANIVMEQIEQTALNTYLNPPSLWLRYVDDVCYTSQSKLLEESLFTAIFTD